MFKTKQMFNIIFFEDWENKNSGYLLICWRWCLCVRLRIQKRSCATNN